MKSTVIRFYDKKDKTSLEGNNYYFVLPKGETFNSFADEWKGDRFYRLQCQVSGLKWQNYTSWVAGTIDIDRRKTEVYWSEITKFELHEAVLDSSKVEITNRGKVFWI